jgi:hypothetical protein
MGMGRKRLGAGETEVVTVRLSGEMVEGLGKMWGTENSLGWKVREAVRRAVEGEAGKKGRPRVGMEVGEAVKVPGDMVEAVRARGPVAEVVRAALGEYLGMEEGAKRESGKVNLQKAGQEGLPAYPADGSVGARRGGYVWAGQVAVVYAALSRAKCGERTLVMVNHKDKRRVEDLVLTMEGFTLEERGLVRVEGV